MDRVQFTNILLNEEDKTNHIIKYFLEIMLYYNIISSFTDIQDNQLHCEVDDDKFKLIILFDNDYDRLRFQNELDRIGDHVNIYQSFYILDY